jgi:hypothetical protein
MMLHGVDEAGSSLRVEGGFDSGAFFGAGFTLGGRVWAKDEADDVEGSASADLGVAFARGDLYAGSIEAIRNRNSGDSIISGVPGRVRVISEEAIVAAL